MIILLGQCFSALVVAAWLAGLAWCSFGGRQQVRRWLLSIPAWLVIVLVRYPAAPIAVAAFSSPDRRFLTRWRWLETIDNDLTGDRDEGWRQTHLWGNDPFSYINRVRWLWRNGGNRFNYEVLGCSWSSATLVRPYTWVNMEGFWLYRRYVPFAGRLIDLYFGWGVTGPKQGLCKFVCQVRFKTAL